MSTPQTFLEVETKFAVSDDTSVPDLTLLFNVDSVRLTRQFELRAVYFDTEDLRLTRSKMTLRRRIGGHDDGWHLKLPDKGFGRTEVGVPFRGEEEAHIEPEQAEVPEQILSQIRAVIRNHALRPIAAVDNHRTESILVNNNDEAIAEFCDDRVHAHSLLPGGQEARWREWEVELSPATATTDAGHRLLESASEVFLTAGARESESPSKLLSALGPSYDQAPAPPQPLEFRGYDDRDEAFAGVLDSLILSRDSLLAADPGTRRGDHEALQQMIEATRDLRSVLKMFVELFEQEDWDQRIDTAKGIDGELKVLSYVLERAHDAEAIDLRLRGVIEADRTALIDDRAQARLVGGSRARVKRERARVTRALDSARYLRVLESLDRFLADPPLPGRLERRKATAIIVRAVKRSFIDFDNRRRDAFPILANPATSKAEWEENLRSLRTYAERLRTVSRIAVDFTPYRAKRLARESYQLVAFLTQAQESLSTREILLNRSRQALRRGEDTFAYGILYQAELTEAHHDVRQVKRHFDQVRAAYKRFKRSIQN